MSFYVPRTFICTNCNKYTRDNYLEMRAHYEERFNQVCPECESPLTYIIAPTKSFIVGKSPDLNPPDRV